MDKKKTPNIPSTKNSFTPPDEQEVRQKQAMGTLIDLGREIKRLGDAAVAKDSRLADLLNSFKEEFEMIIENNTTNATVVVNEINGLFDELKTISDTISGHLNKEKGHFATINHNIVALTDSTSLYGQSSNQLIKILNQGIEDIKKLVNPSETPLGRSNIGEKNTLTRPITAAQANETKITLQKLSAIEQQIESLSIDSIQDSITNLDTTVKRIKSIDEATLNRHLLEFESRLKNHISSSTKDTNAEESVEIDNLRINLEKSEEKIIALEKKIAEIEKNKKTEKPIMKIDRRDGKDDEIKKLKANLGTFEETKNKLTEANEQIKQLETKLEKIEVLRNHPNDTGKIKEITDQNLKLNQLLEKVKGEKLDLNKLLEKSKEGHAQLLEKAKENANLTESLDKAKEKNEGLTESLDKAKEKNEGLTKSLDKVKEKNEGLTKSLDKAKEENEGLSDSLNKAKEENEGLSELLNKANEENEGLSESLNKAKEENESLRKSLEEKKKQDHSSSEGSNSKQLTNLENEKLQLLSEKNALQEQMEKMCNERDAKINELIEQVHKLKVEPSSVEEEDGRPPKRNKQKKRRIGDPNT